MILKENSRKYAIYSRKSRFTGKGESIENQIEMCKKYIRIQDENITDEDILIYEDEGFSGGNTNRPKFKKMMEDIKSDKISAVVCYRLDRISRNVGDFALIFQIFERKNVNFFSVTERYDTSTVSGRAMLSMCTVFAQMERETVAERIKDNMYELAKTGRWLGGVTPTGYKSVKIVNSVTKDGKERNAFRLELIKEEAKTVETIFRKFLETNSLTKTETFLVRNGIKTKNGCDFTRFSIKNILRNPVYMSADKTAWDYFSPLTEIYAKYDDFNGKFGVMAYNKTLQKSGQTNKNRSYNEWIISVGKHIPIIESKDWIKAQTVLNQNSSKSYRKPKSSVALLSGLLYCGKCGSFMRPKGSKRLNMKGKIIYSYLCELKEKSRLHNCNIKNPNGNELDEIVFEAIKNLPQKRSEFIKNIEYLLKKSKFADSEYENQMQALNKALLENEKQIRNLVSSISKSDDLSVAQYIKEEINALHTKNLDIKQEISKLEEDEALDETKFRIFKDSLKSFEENYKAVPLEQKRYILRQIVKGVYWDGENAELYLFDDKRDLKTLR